MVRIKWLKNPNMKGFWYATNKNNRKDKDDMPFVTESACKGRCIQLAIETGIQYNPKYQTI